jgi:hypothetical protein
MPHPVEEVERRHPAARRPLLLLPHHHQPISRRKWQRPEQRRVNQREDGAVGANPESQRDDRDGGKSRRAAKLSQGKLHVVPEFFEPLHHSHVTIPFSAKVHTGPFEVREIAKPFGRLPARGGGVEAAIDQLAGAHVEMESQLLVNLLVNGNSPQPRAERTFHVANTLLTPAEKRRQVATSAASWARPASVSR